jgi:hypothetical protein
MRHGKKLAGVIAGIIVASQVNLSDLVPGTWRKIANENESFTLKQTTSQYVRYGKDGIWTERLVTASGFCTNAFFGLDPSVGVVKQCDVKSGDFVDPPPVNPDPVNHLPGIAVNAASITAANAAAQPGINTPLFTTGAAIPTDYSATTNYNVTPVTGTWEHDGKLRTVCLFTNAAYVDPIVAPGVANGSHNHTFFGRAGVDQNTTVDNIRTGSPYTTCRGGSWNLSAYWVPSMMRITDSTLVVPNRILVYYDTGNWPYMGLNPEIQDMPTGLRMVVGDSSLTPDSVYEDGTPKTNSHQFECMQLSLGYGRTQLNNPNLKGMPTECVHTVDQLWVTVSFGQCWNGELDTTASPGPNNHRAHVAGTIDIGVGATGDIRRTKGCPPTHPLVIPHIAEILMYDITPSDQPTNWQLASDVYRVADPSKRAGYSMHADWMNGWDPDISAVWSENCIRTRRDCGTFTLGDGRLASEFQGN